MIIPIVKSIKGQDQTIGTARVLADSDDVEFYLKPGFSLSEEVTEQLTKQLKRLAKRSSARGLSIFKGSE